MRCSNCGVCCTETEMLLCKRDIERLAKRGFKASSFVQFDNEGYAQLKNRGLYCVFYDAKKHLCKVYTDRPSGCRVYPVIFDDEQGIILDDICNSRDTITKEEKDAKGKRVIRLLERIDSEAEERRS